MLLNLFTTEIAVEILFLQTEEIFIWQKQDKIRQYKCSVVSYQYVSG